MNKVQLRDIAEIIGGGRHKLSGKQFVEAGGFPAYGAGGLNGYLDHVEFRKSAVVLSSIGARCGKCFLTEPEWTSLANTQVIFPNLQKVDLKFLWYQLDDEGRWPRSGAAQPFIKPSDVKAHPILLPPLEEQRRIVAVLDKAFEGIATAIANAQKNLTNARALFEESAQEAYRQSAITKQWSEFTVATVAADHRGAIRTGPFGSQLLHSEFTNEGIAVLGIDNAVANEFRWDRLRFISPQKYQDLSRYRVYPGDVIITIMGTCGRCAVIPDDIPLAINTKHLCCITVDNKKCLPQFLHSYFLYHPIAQEYLGRTAKGSIMAGLNMGLIKEMPFHFPSIAEQERLVKKFGELKRTTEGLVKNIEAKLAALAKLKQSVLQKAFAGELT